MTAECAVKDCSRATERRSYCRRHYYRLLRYGNPEGTGSIRPRGSLEVRFWAHVKRGAPDECWEFDRAAHRGGYGYLGRGGSDGAPIGAHVVSFELHNGPVPNGTFVCHSCDNPPCCNPGHLFLGTRQENVDDMVRKGRQQHGEGHYRAVFTEDDIRCIRKDQRTLAEIAKEYGVGLMAISRIRNRKAWTHVA